jgi:hypothetical protein
MRTNRASSGITRVARRTVLGVALTLLLARPAGAGYWIGWYTIAGGADQSSGLIGSRISPIPVEITGSIGQALPGQAQGGGYSLTAGYWVAAGATYLAGVGSPGPQSPAGLDALRAPQPNPFAGRTQVTFDLSRPGSVELGIFDTTGRLVCTLAKGWYAAGSHALAWDGTYDNRSPAPAGLYFARLVGPTTRNTRTVVLLR